MKPKIWLIIVALTHAGFGVIAQYIEMGGCTENLASILYFLCVTIYLLYVAFMTEGKNQARLTVVLCAPVLVWFIIGAVMKLEMLGMPVAAFPDAIFPFVVWTLPLITGVLNWNSEA